MKTEYDYIYGWIKKKKHTHTKKQNKKKKKKNPVTYVKFSPKMLNPSDIARDAEEEEYKCNVVSVPAPV